MGEHQIIKTEAGEELVVLSRRDFDALMARAGDEAAEDAMTARIVAEADGLAVFPEAVWARIEAGENPIRVFREHRKITQADLAATVGTAQGYISGLESGAKRGSPTVLSKIARVFGVHLEDLLSESYDVVRA